MSENEEQYQVSLALAFLGRYTPCAHENADTGKVWVRCGDCGAIFQQDHWAKIRVACLDFERALATLAGVNEKLLDEYAKQGDARGALGPAWSWVGDEWACDDHEMYVTQINNLEGKLTWCFGYMGCEEIADVGGPREGMRAAEEWSRTHPEEAPDQLPRTTTFSAEEMAVLRKMCLGGIGLTPEETQPICEKLGIG